MSQVTEGDAYDYALGAGFNDQQAQIMAAIAGAESSYDTNNVGDQGLSAYGSRGLWQIFTGAHDPKELGIAQTTAWDPQLVSRLSDPRVNADAAKKVYDEQGFSAWSTYNNGAYKKFLAKGVDAGSTATATGTVGNNGGTSSGGSSFFGVNFGSFFKRFAEFIVGALVLIVLLWFLAGKPAPPAYEALKAV